MARILVAYTFTMVMLVSQLGLPLHMHYCKGMLETVSVFFSLGCDNHEPQPQDISTRDCCKADLTAHCSSENDDCCDDEVKLLTQEITLVSPHFDKWVDVQVGINSQPPIVQTDNQDSGFSNIELHLGTDAGPPIYLMQQALIFYG